MAPSFASLWAQMFPGAPTFTEKDAPNLGGKVYIVTGSTSGMGLELARMLYSKDAKVYIAAREEGNAIANIQKAEPTSKGELVFLHLDLADLNSVKASAERFLSAETKLHVLFNNAGYMAADDKKMETTAQGYEKQLGVMCLGPFLFTKLLTPTLRATAADKSSHTNEVRVVFVSSLAAEFYYEENKGLDLENLNYHRPKLSIERYGLAKVGVWAYGVEFSRRFSGVLGVPLNPGNLRTDLFNQQGFLFRLQVLLLHYHPIKGAYTQLFAGLSPEVTKPGSYILPWGRVGPICEDLQRAAKPESEGGVDLTWKFWDWSEKQVEKFV
ncbi:hypothetical protein J7T55_007978 [Diaporthe amygdali]|uniref:uncharacterized protein n=1 Tax=Phomopsis amygdali TaxID=1214568 RepID=UPI0022FE46AB|nr:uncharacterized protein J7T55_007978 [Diaporthe amygdali]KAJ0114144.1 hypothetical protein J7T55_007978 [Diaporthe amygdali]